MQRTLACAVLAAASLSAAAQSMEPGEWQFVTTMTSPMMPKPQTSTITQCVSKQEADDPTRFTAKEEASDCVVTPGVRTASSYTWTVSCPKQGMSGKGSARFSRGTVESDVQVTMEGQGQKMDMRTTMSGRHVGPCRTK